MSILCIVIEQIQEVTTVQLFVQIGNKYIWKVTIVQIWQHQLLWKKHNDFIQQRVISQTNSTRIQFWVKITKLSINSAKDNQPVQYVFTIWDITFSCILIYWFFIPSTGNFLIWRTSKILANSMIILVKIKFHLGLSDQYKSTHFQFWLKHVQWNSDIFVGFHLNVFI